MKKYVYLNGEFVYENEAKISVFDRGFLFGDGLFETMRAYQGKFFMWESHLSRLYNSAKLLKISIRTNKEVLKKAATKLMELNGLSDAYLRITVSRGKHSGRITFDNKFISTVLIVASELSLYPLEDYRKGIKVVIADVRQNSFSPLPMHKSLNYLNCILAKEEARLKGAKEAIFLNSEGLVAEGATSNIFLVKEGRIYTPSKSEHILPGITRKVVLNIIKELGIEVKEEGIALDDLFRANEIFITNSIMEVLPIKEIDNHIVGDGKPGDIYRLVIDAYRQTVKKN